MAVRRSMTYVAGRLGSVMRSMTYVAGRLRSVMRSMTYVAGRLGSVMRSMTYVAVRRSNYRRPQLNCRSSLPNERRELGGDDSSVATGEASNRDRPVRAAVAERNSALRQ